MTFGYFLRSLKMEHDDDFRSKFSNRNNRRNKWIRLYWDNRWIKNFLRIIAFSAFNEPLIQILSIKRTRTDASTTTKSTTTTSKTTLVPKKSSIYLKNGKRDFVSNPSLHSSSRTRFRVCGSGRCWTMTTTSALNIFWSEGVPFIFLYIDAHN